MQSEKSKIKRIIKGRIIFGVTLSLLFLTLIFSFFLVKKQHNHSNSGSFKTNGSLNNLGSDPSYAAAPQVKGSPNVAVTSYTNSNGTYTLWSDGHITDSQTGATVKSTDQVQMGTTFPSGFTAGTNTYTTGRPKGSPRVAIDIVPHLTGTYILFGDGSIKNPGAPANAPLSSGGPWTRNNGNIYPTTITDNVGIGTVSPAAPLEIKTDNYPALNIVRSNDSKSVNLGFNNNLNAVVLDGYKGDPGGGGTSPRLYLVPGASNNAGGGVAIGGQPPNLSNIGVGSGWQPKTALTVSGIMDMGPPSGGGGSDYTVALELVGTRSVGAPFAFLRFFHAEAPVGAINASMEGGNYRTGAVSISTRSASETAETEKFRITSTGTISGTYGTYHGPSDARLKKDVVTIPIALQKVLKLRGVNFRWKNPKAQDSRLHIGLIAQDVEKIIPEVVHTANDKVRTKAVEYQYLAALLVEAIKELNTEKDKQNEALKQENIFLKEELASIKQENSAIKQELAALKQEMSSLQQAVDRLQLTAKK